MRKGIDSISLNFGTYASGRINTWRTEIIESKLEATNKLKAYQFLSDCDELIDKIRIPRGKLRNMVRKQRKDLDEGLLESTEQYDTIFKNIQNLSFDFVKEIAEGKASNFDELFTKFNGKIKDFGKEIPTIQRDVRQFGIY